MSSTDSDFAIELAGALERRWTKETVVEVYRMAQDRTDPFWAGFQLACDEIAVRLQEAYGEEPTDAAAWVRDSVVPTPAEPK
jgi:hypothetical protein